MRKLTIVPVLLICLAGLFSCEKVIDVDLNSDNPMFVIEGAVTEGEDTHIISITKSLNFDQDQSYPVVDDAVVTLTDDAGNSQVLLPMGNGLYQATAFPGISGRTYTLNVSVEGNSFTASSKMPDFVPLDSLFTTIYNFGDTVRALTPVFTDPGGIANYYQYRLFRNGEFNTAILLQDDQFIDGNTNEQPIFLGEAELNDTITLELLCIDKPVYKYFYALDQNSTATPANPESNFGKSCLGYFSARTRSVKTLVIPE